MIKNIQNVNEFICKLKVGVHADYTSNEDSDEDMEMKLNKISALSQTKDDEASAPASVEDKTYWHRQRKC